MASRNITNIVRKALIGLVALLVVIQFIRPVKNISTTPAVQDIAAVYPVPDSVYHILKTTCYDCHSNSTQYPWYNNVQPVAWWLDDHVQEGKEELNFSEFGGFKTKRKLKKLKEIVHEVEEHKMPLESYTWMHRNAVLTAGDRDMLIAWAKGLSQQINVKAMAEQEHLE